MAENDGKESLLWSRLAVFLFTNPIKFQWQDGGTSIRVTSYHYYDTVSKSLNIEEQKESVFRIPADCTPCIKKYSFTFQTDGREEQLRGSWTGKTMDGMSNCPPGTIVLTRILKSAFKPEIPPVLIERKLELVKEIKSRHR